MELPLLPLRDIVMFPGMKIPLLVGRARSMSAIFAVTPPKREIFLVAQRDGAIIDPQEEDIFSVGCLAHIEAINRVHNSKLKVMLEGVSRARIAKYTSNKPYFRVELETLNDTYSEQTNELEALFRSARKAFSRHLSFNTNLPKELKATADALNDPVKFLNTVAAYLTIKLTDKQTLLELPTTAERLNKLVEVIEAENEILLLERRIKNRVDKQMRKNQRDYYLNEKMQAIQKELGDGDEFQNEIKEIEEQLANRPDLSEEALERIEKELRKFKMMTPLSAEATVVRNYIDWVLSLPWGRLKEEKHDINEASGILEEDHYGLEKVKERILEYLSVHSLVPHIKGPILCFVGPPGVGKTSLARSIARATNREFVRLSLGGVRDEAEIRGHRRTYIGALPGKIIQSLKKVSTNNPVFLLDEVDKMSSDFRGDPAAALLEVLDPEQNHAFDDHYLDLDYDLSKVMFITTANTTDGIPLPLQDRMEIIRLPGYTEQEKTEIAKRYLIPKQMEQNGLSQLKVETLQSAIVAIIRNYTREAGVRELERKLAAVYRKIARRYLEKEKKEVDLVVGDTLVFKLLGVPPFKEESQIKHDEVGIAIGLAWTSVGGEILRVETVLMPGKGTLTLTGQLGDVMKESAQAALSFIRSRSREFGIEPLLYEKTDIHVHVPEGAVPKDGPSAGITIASSILSALTGIPARSDVAMTGEITLRGRILPIGGLKEKALAAHRYNIENVIIPADNEKDLPDLSQEVRDAIKFIFVSHMEEALPLVLTAKPTPLIDGVQLGKTSIANDGLAPEGDH